MGGSSKQVTGHKYFASFVGVLGNCIEGVWGWNFDNRGWIKHPKGHLIKAGKFSIDASYLYGETEGGVAGLIDIKDGDLNQTSNEIYAEYLAQNDMPSVAYRFLSYLIYEDFYWGNSSYMKEVLVWPKRIHKKFNGSAQWYDVKAEIPDFEYLSSGDGTITNGNFLLKRTIVGKIKNKRDNTVVDYLAQYNNGVVTGVGYTAIGVTSYSEQDKDWEGPHYSRWEFDATKLTGFIKINYAVSRRSQNMDFNFIISTNVVSDRLLRSYVLYDENHVPTHVQEREAVINLTDSTAVGIEFTMSGGYQLPDHVKTIHCSINAEFSPVVGSDEFYIASGDMNPIHKIREILTDYTALNKSELDIDDENFKRAADRIYDESLGISYAIQEAKCIDVLNDLCSHIEGAVRINRQTGKYQIVLFRDDWFDLNEVQSFSEKSIKSFEAEITNVDGPVNVLNVNFYDRANIKNTSFNLADIGSIHTLGGEVSETVEFPYFMKRSRAEKVANWKLKQLSTGAWKGTFSTGKYEARKINRYDVIKISFAKRGINDLPVRVMNINLGNGRENTVSIDFVEVVSYSNQNFTSIIVDPPVESALSPQPTEPTIFEMPYFEAVQQFGQSQVELELSNNPNLGYLAVAAQKPQNNSLNALLYTDAGTGVYTNFERVSSLSYCQALYLDQKIGYLDTSFAVDDTDYVKQRKVPKFQNAQSDTIIQLNDELMSFVSYNTETNIITVKRGVLDTIPKKHTSGTLVFWGESIAYDTTQYVQSETVQAQVVTTTPSAVQWLNIENVVKLEIEARAIRPYPPAAVKINNAFFPDSIDVTVNNIEINWLDRNRLQQTGGSILNWTDNSVTKESGTSYSLELICNDEVLLHAESLSTNSYEIDKSILLLNKYHTLKIWSVRDGFQSFQKYEHEFFAQAEIVLSATINKSNVIGKTAPQANVCAIVDEGLKANLKFDGTEIRGKSEPGASITIEVNVE